MDPERRGPAGTTRQIREEEQLMGDSEQRCQDEK